MYVLIILIKLTLFTKFRMKDMINSLQNDVNKMDEPREMDKLFHQRINSLESKMDGIRNEVREAVSDMMEGESCGLGGGVICMVHLEAINYSHSYYYQSDI